MGLFLFFSVAIYQQVYVINDLKSNNQVMREALQLSNTVKGEGIDEPLLEKPEKRAIYLTGALTPENISLEEMRRIVTITSEPEQTNFRFIPGGVEHIKEILNALPLKIRPEQAYSQDNLFVHRLSAEMPDSSTIEIFIITK